MKHSAVPERRRSQRTLMIKSGMLISGAANLRCAVLDASHSGARVLLLDGATAFEVGLLSLADGTIRAVQLCWQRDREVGFTFLHCDEPDEGS
ncbi:PilZ domain-containing protein [Falsiroseomonas sp. HC035]|uniref:PilZ domain-containing protein n=1 Tax=Falsiroseomonas sp. HC035 TaxID=3390999 RepID=UPI003D31F46F